MAGAKSASRVSESFRERLPDAFAGYDPAAAAAAVAGFVDRAGVTFGLGAFRLDPVPRVLARAEWEPLAAGLGQRVKALDRFVADVYGERRIVRDGVLAEAAVTSADHFEPLMARRDGATRRFITIAGLDCVRGPDGAFRVLEDNVRTPSGPAYTAVARAAVTAHVAPPPDLVALDAAIEAFAAAVRDAAPEGVGEPRVAVISDGPGNSAHWEHAALAERFGAPLVTLGDLRVRGGRLHAGDTPVDVGYRRTDEDRLTDAGGKLTPVGELLLEPWSRGHLGLVNAFGTGVADDKLLHAHVEDMIRYYLDEEPLVESVKTYDLSDPGVLDEALERLAELVVKPRAGQGGEGVVIGPLASAAELGAAADALRAAPEDHVVQTFAPLSLHPTVVGGVLQERHVDLRPFVFYGAGEPVALPGGLTRVALDEGGMVVNSSREGGVKDTWVVG